jgi:hypothetical protein
MESAEQEHEAVTIPAFRDLLRTLTPRTSKSSSPFKSRAVLDITSDEETASEDQAEPFLPSSPPFFTINGELDTTPSILTPPPDLERSSSPEKRWIVSKSPLKGAARPPGDYSDESDDPLDCL